jgi:nitrate reductase gamma subunit
MEAWLAWARGPMLWAALTFMALGLARRVGITVWEVVRALRRAGDKNIPARQVAAATLRWLFPPDRLGNRPLFGVTTLLFHVSILLVPLFLAGHIALWAPILGFRLPTLPNWLASWLTVAAVVTALALVVERIASRATRFLSRFQDYALPLVVAVPFLSGFLVMHPAWNPFSFEATLLVHVLSADFVLILVPITKLSHVVLLPATQLVSELAWHFPPDAGSKVGLALHKESEPI